MRSRPSTGQAQRPTRMRRNPAPVGDRGKGLARLDGVGHTQEHGLEVVRGRVVGLESHAEGLEALGQLPWVRPGQRRGLEVEELNPASWYEPRRLVEGTDRREKVTGGQGDAAQQSALAELKSGRTRRPMPPSGSPEVVMGIDALRSRQTREQRLLALEELGRRGVAHRGWRPPRGSSAPPAPRRCPPFHAEVRVLLGRSSRSGLVSSPRTNAHRVRDWQAISGATERAFP